jgi:hypothetical protein
MNKKNILISASNSIPYYYHEVLQNAICRLDSESPTKEADIVLVEIMPKLLKKRFQEYIFEDCSWRWHWSDITQSKYPLEYLPDHVREIVRELYYNRNPGK